MFRLHDISPSNTDFRSPKSNQPWDSTKLEWTAGFKCVGRAWEWRLCRRKLAYELARGMTVLSSKSGSPYPAAPLAAASLDLSGLLVRSPSWQAGIQEHMLSTGPQG